MHDFDLGPCQISLTLHVFDPIQFCSQIKVDELHDAIEADLKSMEKWYQKDYFRGLESQQALSSLFFELNQKYQRYGIGITQIIPGAKETKPRADIDLNK
jgi:hypothetical protein